MPRHLPYLLALSAVGIQTIFWTRFPPLWPSPFQVNVAFVAQPLPGECCCVLNSLHTACLCTNRPILVPAADGIDQGYIVLNRPYAVLQWVRQQLPLLMEDYVLMLEPVSSSAKFPLFGFFAT